MTSSSLFLPASRWRAACVCVAVALSSAASLFAGASSDGEKAVEYIVSVYTERSAAVYHKGEPVNFEVYLEHNRQPATEGAVVWKLTKDGVIPPLQTGTATLNAEGRAVVTGTLGEPGFLQCEVSFKGTDKNYTALAAAAIDPSDIQPSLPKPADFDAFWAEKKKQLAAVPINPKLTSVPPPAGRTGVETFEFQADCVGNPASGYYARPVGAKPKSCPALLYVEGAGVVATDLLAPTRYAQKGVLALDLNAHGIPVGKPREYYNDLANGELKDYRVRGRESRDTYYFLGMYLRAQRGLDFLTSQPEWDGRTLLVVGVSQGGAQSLAATSLDPRVTFTVACVPGQCDPSGPVVGRIAGWPKVVPKGADGKLDPKALEAMRYFDTVNFATRIKTPVYGWIGFCDVTCPPTGSYAAFNQLAGPKTIVNDPVRGHDAGGPGVWMAISKAVDAHIAEQAKAAQ
ncbi:MAG: acetylxylan esterase [Chthoniobacteraceae bacterium]